MEKARSYLNGIEKRLFLYSEDLLGRVMNAPNESVPDPEILKCNSVLALMRGFAFLLVHRSEISFFFFLVGSFAYLAVYARISLLFAFVYLGIAKLDHTSLAFLDSTVNAIAIPVSFTNFPRDWRIQSVEVMHTMIVVVLGFEAAAAYWRRKTEILNDVADKLWRRLDEETIRSKMSDLANYGKPTQPSSTIT